MNGFVGFLKCYNTLEFIPRSVLYVGATDRGYEIPHRPKKCTKGMTVEDLAPLIKKGIVFYAGCTELGLKRGGNCWFEAILIEFDIMDDGELVVNEADNLLDYGNAEDLYNNSLQYLKEMEQVNLGAWKDYVEGESMPSNAPHYRTEYFR